MSAQYEATWASNDETLLRVAVEAVASEGVAATPLARVEWGGVVSWAVRLSSTNPLPEPPSGVRNEAAAVAGVFMRGPAKPTPREWMGRLSKEAQFRIYAAGTQSPEVGFLLFNLTAAQSIDPNDPETIAGVKALEAAALLTAAEAAALLRP